MTGEYFSEMEILPRAEMRQYQLHHLQEQVRHATEDSPFYRRKLAAAGVAPADIRSLDDIRRLPFTTKEELRQAQEEHPPWGDLVAVPPGQVQRVHLTSGTTGKAVAITDTREDWVQFHRMYARDLYGMGIRAEDMVMPAFSFGPWIGFWAGWYAAEDIGCAVLPTGGFSTEQRIELLLRQPITVLGSTPSYALYLAEQARKQGIDLATQSKVRITWHTGEPGAGIPGTKRKIEAAFGAKCYDLPGVTEIGPWGFECRHQSGLIHVNEDWAYPEVLDSETGAPVEPGEKGELIFTNLHRKAFPVLRYRTRDLVQVAERTCPCGRTLLSLEGGIIGRLDDLKKIRGVVVYPSRVEEVVRRRGEIEEYTVRIRRVEGLDDILVQVEPNPQVDAQATAQLVAQLAADLKLSLGIRISVEACAPGSLKRWDHKAKRVIDERTDVPF